MANQIFGSAAVAVHMYQAFYGKAPSNALYESYVAQIGTSDGSAFAKTMASAFDGVTDTALALQVLTNLGITAVTVPATGEYAKLLAALTQAFAAFPTMRGQVILNATNLFANLEGDATYGAAATTYNDGSLNNFAYAANPANTAPGTPNNAISAISDGNTAANSVAENAAVGTASGLTALASDPGAVITYSLIDSASGKFAINSNTGIVTVAGALDYETATSHSITVQAASSDGSAPVTQTYTIAVTNLNDNAVSAVADSNTATNTVAENSAVGTVVGLTALATDADTGATITYSLSNDASGKFAINATTGVVTVNGALDFEALTSHSVTVLATSSDGSTNSQAFTVAVSNVNDVAPVFTSAATLTASEDTAATYTATATDADSTAVTFTAGAASNGTVAAGTTAGTFVYTPALNYNGTDSFVVTASDGLNTTTQTVTVTVAAVNDAPVFAAATQAVAATEDTAATVTVAATDVDNATVAYTAGAAAHGTVAAGTAAGTFVYTPALNYNGTDSFVVTATDAAGLTATQTINLTIAAVNDAPVITSVATLAATEDTAATYTVTATDVDNTSVTATAGAASQGTVVAGTSAGAFVYTPALNYNGADSFTVTVADGSGGTASQTIAVTIAAVNDAPVFAAATQAVAATEDTAATVTVAATDVDNTTVAYTAGAAANGTVVAGTTAGTFVYTPTANYNGTDSFVVTATDAAGLTATQTVNLTIAAVNDAPVFAAATQAVAATEDTAATVTVAATDVDNTTLTYTAGAAANGTVVAGTTAGTFVYTPTANYNGADSFVVTATDAGGLTATQTINLTIAAVNDAPVVATTASAYTISSGTTAVTTATATDVDGTTPTFTKSGADAALFTINATTGALAFAAAPDFNFAASAAGTNTYSVTVGATDGALTSTKDVTVSVSQLPIPTYTLTATSVDDVAQGAAVSEGKSVTYTVTASAAVTGTTVIPITVSGAGSTAANIGSAAPTSVTIAAGATTASFTVNVLEDLISDNGAVMTVALGNTATITGTSASAVQVYANSLLDRVAPKSTAELNVVPATLTVTQSAASISEAAGSSVLTFTLSTAMSNDTVITLNAADSAGAAAAHSSVPASVTIAAGALTGTLTVTGVDNTTYDGATARTLQIVPTANNALLSGSGPTITITDNEAVPAVSTAVAAAATIAEGGTASWTVTLNNASSVATTVPYTITGVGATTGNLSFAAGETSKVLTLAAPAVDGKYYGDLTTTLAVGSLTSAVAVTEGNPLTVSVAATAGATSVNEGSSASFTISTNLPTGTVVSYTIAGTSGAADHAGVSGTTAVDASGQAVVSFATTADYLTEGAETVTMTATSGTTTSTAASLTINDTTLTPTFSITGGAATLENATASYTVSLANGNAAQAYTVDLAATGSGGAVAADWGTITATGATLVGSTLTFAAGATSATISVPITRDSYTPESGEGVKVTLSNPTGGTAVVGATSNATVAVTDVAPVFTVAPLVNALDEGGTAVTFTVTSTIPMSADQTFTWTLLGATNTSTFTSAANTADFVLNSASVTMLAGATTATFTVSANADTVTEGLEGFTANVFNSSNTLVAQSAMVSINDLSTGNDAVQTFVLTTGPNNFLGLNANDSFDGISNANSLNSADTLTGGAGISDTINATLTTAAQVIRPTLATIEKIILTATGSATLDLSSSTGYDALTSQLSTAALTFDNIGTATTAGTVISNQTGVATSVTYKYTNAALSGSADTMALTVTGFGNGGNDETIFVARAAGATNALETVAMTGATLANNFDLDLSGSAAVTLSIAGSVNETVKVINPTTLTTINAGSSSGANVLTLSGVFAGTVTGGTSTDSLTLANATNTLSVSSVNSITGVGGNDAITVTDTAATTVISGGGDDKLVGGTGNTRFDVTTTFDANDTVTGGAGTDTLVIAAADAGVTTTKVTAIEVLEVTTALGNASYTLANISSGINTLKLAGDNAGGTTVVGGSGLSTINLATTALAGAMTVSGGSGATDALTINNAEGTAMNVYNGKALTLSAFETVTINDSATGNTTAQTITTLAVDPTSGGGTINFGGSNQISVTTGITSATTGALAISGASLTKTTGTTLTIAAITAAGATSIAVTGSAGNDSITTVTVASIDGGAGNDTLTGAAGADTLVGGTGNNVLNGGSGGNDSMVGGSGNDTFVFAGALTANDTVTGGGGTDLLQGTQADFGGLTSTKITGVQTIEVTDAVTADTINVANIASSATRLNLTSVAAAMTTGARSITGPAGSFTVGLGASSVVGNGTPNTLGGALTLVATGTAATDSVTVINSTINTTPATPVAVNVFAGQGFTSTGYENVTFQVGSPTTSPADTIGTLLVTASTASSPTSLTLTGSNDVQITSAQTNSTGLFTINAAGISAGADATWVTISGTSSGVGGTQSITGSDGNDTITIGNFASTISGGLGTDTIVGGSANDVIDGGAGNDTITSGGGNDSLVGGTGNDKFVMAGTLTTNDTIVGGAEAADEITADTGLVAGSFTNVGGVEKLTASGGAVTWTLGADASTAGITTVTLSTSNDTLVLAAGFANAVTVAMNADTANTDSITNTANATLTVSGTPDDIDAGTTIAGGTGTDTLLLTADNSTANIDKISGIETITLVAGTVVTDDVTIIMGANDTQIASAATLVVNASAFTDVGAVLTFTGNAAETNGAVSITGGAGPDVLTGTAGNDTFNVATGDSVNGGNGNNTYNFSGAITAATVVGGTGNDTITFAGSVTDATLTGGGGTDTVTFNGSGNTATKVNGFASVGGSAGTDTITFVTTAAVATMSGGGGADTVNLGNVAGNIFTYVTGSGTVTVNDNAAGNADKITISGSGNATITSAGGVDTLVGGSGTNTYTFASSGLDTDSIVGGSGTDTVSITAGGGVSTMTNVTGVEVVNFTAGAAETITLSTGVVSVTGGLLNQLIILGAAQTAALSVNLGATGGDTLTLASGSNTGVITVTGVSTVTGNNGDDRVTATTATTINADAGAGNGNDWLIGSTGDDTFVFSASLTAVDTITGGGGNDTIKYSGATGTVDLSGAGGMSTLAFTGATYTGTVVSLGASGATTITGGTGLEALTFTSTLTGITFSLGSAGTDDTIQLSSGTNNSVNIASLNVSVTGGDGADTINWKTGATGTVNGGLGTDTLVFGNTGLTAKVQNAESITGSSGADTVTYITNGASSSMSGGGGADAVNLLAGTANTFTINTTGGTATITGNTGADTVTVTGSGAATIIGGNSNGDVLTGGDGNDLIQVLTAVTQAAGTVAGGAGSLDVLEITGTAGALDLTKVSAVEILKLTAAGTYTVSAGAASNLTIDGATTGANDLTLANVANSSVTLQNFAASSTIVGGSAADQITVGATGAVALSISGAAGNDTIVGTNANTDTITGGAGADQLTGGTGADVFKYALVSESSGANLDTITDFVSGTDTLQFTVTVPTSSSPNANVFTVNVLTPLTTTAFASSSPLSSTGGEVVVLTDTNQVVVDTNGDGVLNAADYRVILSGVSAVTSASLSFVITANANANSITGGDGADSITGGTLVDTINGGAGADTIIGGTGADLITGGAGNDTIDVTAEGAADTVYISAGTASTLAAVNTANGLDTITGFAVANDVLNFAAIAAVTAGTTTQKSTKVTTLTDALTVGDNLIQLDDAAPFLVADATALAALTTVFTGVTTGNVLVAYSATIGGNARIALVTLTAGDISSAVDLVTLVGVGVDAVTAGMITMA